MRLAFAHAERESNYGMSTPELANVRTVDNGIIFLGKNYCRLKRGSNKFAVLPPLSREKALQRLCAELGM